MTPAEGTIALNNALFGTSFDGSIQGNSQRAFTGTKDGVTVVYAKGTGSNMYLNDEHLRLYQGNTLTVSVATGLLTKLEFTLATSTTKTLEASTGTVASCASMV